VKIVRPAHGLGFTKTNTKPNDTKPNKNKNPMRQNGALSIIHLPSPTANGSETYSELDTYRFIEARDNWNTKFEE
jgi:hypothetical protein